MRRIVCDRCEKDVNNDNCTDLSVYGGASFRNTKIMSDLCLTCSNELKTLLIDNHFAEMIQDRPHNNRSVPQAFTTIPTLQSIEVSDAEQARGNA